MLNDQAYADLSTDEDVTRQTTGLLQEALQEANPTASLIRTQHTILAELEGRVQRKLTELPVVNGRPIACRKGCGLCCRRPVSTLPQEAITLADYVRRTFNPLAQWKLKRRLERYTRDLQRRRRRACPFLVHGSCSVYEVRPMMCRTHHSYDFSECNLDRKELPTGAQPFYDILFPFSEGALRAFPPHQVGPFGHDLGLSFGIAWQCPDAGEQISSNVDLFEPALLTRSLM